MAQPQWPVPVFRWLRQNQDLELQQMQQDEHIEVLCWRLSCAQSDKDIRTCRELIPGGKVTAAFAKYVLKYGEYEGYTLLGAALESWYYRLSSTADKDELENFIRELIAQGANLHHCRRLTGFSRPPTLLQTLVRWKINHGAYALKQAVKKLLALFKTAGADVLEYWEVEQSYGWQSFDPAAVYPPWDNRPIYKIINFQIGERPEDILIELEKPYFTTPLIANSWYWVEPPSDQDRSDNSTSIPGAWQDE
ncbi:hypothetical protein B0J14DRAFT_657656 [Halenospora varia]|nr:hypothetical protein B0J14DRAFT_657656 [Halenospora varia]